MTPLETYQQRVDRLTQQKQELTSRLRSYSVDKYSPEWHELKRDLNETKVLLTFAEIDLEEATPRKVTPSNATDGSGAVMVFYIVLTLIFLFILIL